MVLFTGFLVSLQICDSLKTKLNRVSMKCVHVLYRNMVGASGKFISTFLPVQKQTDGYNCGPLSIAYAAEILDGKSPIEASFDVKKMRCHLISCLQKQQLTPFPKLYEN